MRAADALAAIPEAERAGLLVRSDRAGLLHLAGHGGAILAVSALILGGAPLWWLLLPLQGVLVMFLFTLLHETVHGTPFARPALNRAAGLAAGFLVLVPPLWFRFFHLAHHRHTQDPAHDPELRGGGPPATRAAFALHLTGLPTWAANLRTLAANALRPPGDAWIPEPARARVTREARAFLLGYALVLAALPVLPGLLWVWILPVLLGQPVLRAYLLAEHGCCPFVADMLANTRTTFTNRVVRFISWNMPFHAEHHAAPQVPFHKLPDLHRHLAPHLKVTAPGYVAFTRAFAADLPGRA